MQTTRTKIQSEWRFQEKYADTTPSHLKLGWLPAQVPGHVHLDLMRAGVIAEPFARMHESGVSWVDERDWIYETVFHVAGPAPAHPILRFNGLDTIATVELNGREIGRSDNMYIAHEFDASTALRVGDGQDGDNTLTVTFRSALAVGRERKQQWDSGPDAASPHWDIWSERAMVRKAQYMYGWDWGPVLISCGIWKSIELIGVPAARMTDWRYDFAEDVSGKTVVTMTADIVRTEPGAPIALRAMLTDSVGGRFESLPASIPGEVGRHTVSAQVAVDKARLWQPAGLCGPGGPELYELDMSLTSGGIQVDRIEAAIGLRTVELVHEADPDGKGEGFKFRVNGRDVFAKGANWIPDDSFPSRISAASLRERISQAHAAGMNMLRIWGGGLYESEEFYAICDQLGVMVWQDFPYACSYYPDTGEYADAARVEAGAAVRRIRNHPSLALWCGNNENRTMYEDKWMGVTPPRYVGEHLYDEVLPQVVASECPGISYWPSSPYGGPSANGQDYGDCHNWDVWHGRGDWVHYTENDCRFCSEFGFASSCSLPAWDTVLAPEDRDPRSSVVRWHDKTRKGYDTYLGYIDLHFPAIRSLDDLVYYSQINQAEALRYGVEHYRRRKGRCWGTLFWQLNDCWPVQSWSVIDSLGEPKAAYFACKRFYAGMLVSLYVKDGKVEAHLVSDLPEPVSGELSVRICSFDGEVLAKTSTKVDIGANTSIKALEYPLEAVAGKERSAYVCAEFSGHGGAATSAIALLAEPKNLELADPGISISVSESGGKAAITVTATKFAPYVWISRADSGPLRLEDNFFHLQPGEMRTVRIINIAEVDAAALADVLTVRTLHTGR